eukprot:COSAG02_NODE_67019_length_254_cov_0.632258_1_plen_30_part_01
MNMRNNYVMAGMRHGGSMFRNSQEIRSATS